MTLYGLLAVMAALVAVLYCGSNPTCHDVLPSIAGIAFTVVGGVFGLAKAEQARRRKHRSTDNIPDHSGDHGAK